MLAPLSWHKQLLLVSQEEFPVLDLGRVALVKMPMQLRITIYDLRVTTRTVFGCLFFVEGIGRGYMG
jgi:hypothetical protein